eukprot:s5105_g2.t1
MSNFQLHLLPAARLRLFISQGWYTWRLLTRALQENLDVSAIDFLKPFEEMVCLFLGPLKDAFFHAMLFGVLDKPTCVAMWLSLTAMLRTAELCVQLLWQDLPFLQNWGAPCATCTRTPAFRHCSCSLHCEKNAADGLREMLRLHSWNQGLWRGRQLAKSAGLLCACLSEGVILYMQEIYGCESLSQRYLCIAALKDLLPSLSTVVRDDACHLHKYTQRRAMHSAAAADIAPPSMTYVCDKVHMAGHTDEWRKQTCDPALPANAARLHGVRTSVCEFTFTWVSKYKHQTKHMTEYGFHFFLLDMAWSHSEIILQGGYRPEEVASSSTLENCE